MSKMKQVMRCLDVRFFGIAVVLVLVTGCASSHRTPPTVERPDELPSATVAQVQPAAQAAPASPLAQNTPQPECVRLVTEISEDSPPCDIIQGLGVNKSACSQSAPPQGKCAKAEKMRSGGIQHSISIPIHFDFNSAELSAQAEKRLARVAEILNYDELKGLTFSVEGHTDAKGTDEYNLHLSQLRAQAVQRYLIERHSIAPHRLPFQGKGEQWPLPDKDPYDAAQRRVEFVKY
jgi:outer membrane protein OmpA-like peptidoglycan-associated protein